jgi:hypothetical protein
MMASAAGSEAGGGGPVGLNADEDVAGSSRPSTAATHLKYQPSK